MDDLASIVVELLDLALELGSLSSTRAKKPRHRGRDSEARLSLAGPEEVLPRDDGIHESIAGIAAHLSC